MTLRHLSAAVAAFAVLTLAQAGRADAAPTVTLVTTLDGQPVASSTSSHPLKLVPDRPLDVTVSVTDHGSAPIDVHRVSIAGRVVGLTFYSFDTAVDLAVPAGATRTVRYSVDLTGLSGQATGLIGGSVRIYDAQNHQLAEQASVTDVRGSLWSVYGLFGFALLLLTVLALLDTALAMARHRLPANRWRRALRFLTPGIGIGLVIVFTLSATRVLLPGAAAWLIIGAVSAVAFFALGYLTPTPVDDRDVAEDDDDADYADEQADQQVSPPTDVFALGAPPAPAP